MITQSCLRKVFFIIHLLSWERRVAQPEELQGAVGQLQQVSEHEAQLVSEVTGLGNKKDPVATESPVASSSGVDTRTRGRPDFFNGEESNWADQKVAMKAYTLLSASR